MDKHSYLSNADPAALDAVYQQYLKDPASVDPGWARFFEGFELAPPGWRPDQWEHPGW